MQVLVNRGQQTYRTVESGYTQLAETGLYRAVYPVYDFDNQTYCESRHMTFDTCSRLCDPPHSVCWPMREAGHYPDEACVMCDKATQQSE